MIRSTLAREILVAVPGTVDDLYLRHQQVWEAAANRLNANDGRQFLFRREGPQIYRVRSSTLRAQDAQVAELPTAEGLYSFEVDLVAMAGTNHEDPVHSNKVEEWVTRLLQRNGFDVASFRLQSLHWQRGLKRAKFERNQSMQIAYQVASVAGTLKVADQKLAQDAFVSGVGRGRRFGFGMMKLRRIPNP